MDIKVLDSKYVDSSLVNSLLEKHVNSEVDFLNAIATMKEKARVEFNNVQGNKDSANSEDSIVAHADYEMLSVVESLAKAYFGSNN